MRTNLKVIGATTLCIFSLSTAFTATLAWFQFNSNAPVTGMNVRVSLGETDLSQLTVHRCDLSNSTSTRLKFYEDPEVIVEGHGSVVVASGVQMDNYSTLNQSQPVLLLFTFSEEIYEDDLTITATTEHATFTTSLTEQNVSNFPFSSTVTFKCMKFSSNDFPFSGFDLVDGNEDPLYSSASFVTINGTGENATYTYNASQTLFDGASHTRITYLGVILDYYPAAIEYIKGHTNDYAGIVLGNNNIINYYCDWSLEM